MKKHLLALMLSCLLAGASMPDVSAQSPQSTALKTTYAAHAKQRQELSREYGITEEQSKQIQQFSWERTQQINALGKHLTKAEYRAQRDEITDEYYRKVAGILTPEQRAKFNPEAFKATRADEIKRLKLPRAQALKMGELKATYDAQVAALTEQNIPSRERKSQKETLDKAYHAKLKALLGEAKFTQWLNYKNTTLERKYKAKYGFTAAQFNKYKAIENKKAIDMLAIKKSAIPAAEKAVKIQAVKDAKIESLRAILSSEQFDKWHKDYLQAEQKRSSNRKK